MSVAKQTPEQETGEKLTYRHYMNRRLLQYGTLLTIAVTAIIGLNAVFAGKDKQRQPVEPKLIPVETLILDEADSFEVKRTYTGIVKAVRTSELSFRRTAELTSVLVKEGTRVKKNELLATVDDRSLQARKQELLAKKNAAQALLNELVAGPRKQTIASARAEVSQMQAELELEQAELQRARKLFEDAVISRSKFDTVQFGTRAALARLEAATQKLVELEAGTRPEKINAQRAVVDQLAAMLIDVAVDLDQSQLKAPYAGVISKRYTDEGTIVSPAEAILRLVDDTDLEAWVGLPAANAINFSVSDKHPLEVDGNKIDAIVSAVLPELDPATRTRTVIFDLGNSNSNRIVPFQIIRIQVEQQNNTKGFWVPMTSLVQSKRGLWAIYVVEPIEQGSIFVVARRNVEVLHLQDVRAFVRGTIQSGERIIADGTHRVVAGQQVSLIAD